MTMTVSNGRGYVDGKVNAKRVKDVIGAIGVDSLYSPIVRIMLGSNNYLGLTVQPEIIEAGVKTLEQYGTGCSGSRFLNGTLQMHYELEDELKKFLRKEDCITFPTGFMRNLGIIL